VKYPWVFVAICGIWFSTLAVMVLKKGEIDATQLFLFGAFSAVILFLIGFKSK